MSSNTLSSHNTYVFMMLYIKKFSFSTSVDKWIIIPLLCMPLIFTECFCLSLFLLASAEQEKRLNGVSITCHSTPLYMLQEQYGNCDEQDNTIHKNGCETATVTHNQSHLCCVRRPHKTFTCLFPWHGWLHFCRPA